MRKNNTLLNTDQATTLPMTLHHIADIIDNYKDVDPLAHEGFGGDSRLLNAMTIPEWLRQEADNLPGATFDPTKEEFVKTFRHFIDPTPCDYNEVWGVSRFLDRPLDERGSRTWQ